jgi:plastocyanin
MFLLAAALLAATPQPSTSPVVTIRDDAFVPASLTISAGQTVTFVNRDDDAHTVTSTGGAFDSKGLDTNGVWRYTFAHPGTFRYICELHPFMKGTIVVKAVKS